MKLWEYIKQRMLQHPEQTISENDVSMTYENLCIFAESYAKNLTDDRYAILCNSEMAAAMAVLSCMAAGKTAIPLPVRYGKEKYMSIWKRAGTPSVIADVYGELKVFPTNTCDRSEMSKQHTSVMLFTSGSTGHPKGIMLSEDNLLSNVNGIMSYFPIDDKDTILISRPLYHSSVLTGEFLLSICSGAKIVFSSEPFQPLNIIKLMKEHKVTVFGNTPTLLAMLSRFVRASRELSIRLLSISGECMTAGMASDIRKAFPKADIYCGYGLSEASPRVAYLSANLFDTDPICAGKPLPHVKIMIIRPNGDPAKKGEIGEVIVKGKNVMIGYFDDIALTRKTKKRGWLHTGDIGYIDKQGKLYIKGRKDDMIIRAGMNIYPSEIENTLSKDSRVRQVIAYGYFDGYTQQIGLKISGDFENENDVRLLCSNLLPSYEIPSKIELVNAVSHESSGKRVRREK